jgi:hypothetical protein
MTSDMLRWTFDLHRAYEPRKVSWPGVDICAVFVSNVAGVFISLIEMSELAVRAWLLDREAELFDRARPPSKHAQLCDRVLPYSALFAT